MNVLQTVLAMTYQATNFRAFVLPILTVLLIGSLGCNKSVLDDPRANFLEFRLDGERYQGTITWDHKYREDWVSVRFRPGEGSDVQMLVRNDLDYPDEVIFNDGYAGIGGLFFFNILGNDWRSTSSGSDIEFERIKHEDTGEVDSLGYPIWVLKGEFEGIIANGAGITKELKRGKVSFTYSQDR